jgi:hypothetical protein
VSRPFQPIGGVVESHLSTLTALAVVGGLMRFADEIFVAIDKH